MGFDRRFTAMTLLLVALLGVAITGLVLAVQRDDLGATRIVAALIVVAVAATLVHHVERTNRTLARFVEALNHQDAAMRFSERGGPSFAMLGAAFNGAIRASQAERARGLEELRFWEAVVDDIPIALLTVDDASGVRTLNKAARRLFDRHDGVRPSDFATYGAAFADLLVSAAPSPQAIRTIDFARGPHRAIVSVAAITRLGAPIRVIAVDPVQATLDAVEVETQSDVVRVLTHEILNSLTPVTSLAGSAAGLLGEEVPDIAEARLAVLTLARRAEGLRRFIDSYRAVARAPELRRRRFAAAPFAAELARLFRAEWIEHGLTVSVDPDAVIDADPDLLAQALINLLRNAAQATGDRGRIDLRIMSTASGVMIEVEDDGPGIRESARKDIFLPFFTTRAQGTGVGLSLVRQIMVAHGWHIDLTTGSAGGALFRLTSDQQ